MRKVALYSGLLLIGLVLSQLLPLLGEAHAPAKSAVDLLTIIGLSFIMIHVGYEFEIDKHNMSRYGWDYVVAMTAAAFPWLMVTAYFLFVMLPPEVWHTGLAWKQTLLAGRFAAPTSAGVLFTMLAASGLSFTWMFRKARVLAIFDDLDTILLMIPLKMLLIGWAWQLLGVALVMLAMLYVAWRWLNSLHWPATWPWVLGYSIAIALGTELVYLGSTIFDPNVPIHLEVLLPAFMLGCLLRRPEHPKGIHEGESHMRHHLLDMPSEQRATVIVSAVFMLLVGMSMPPLLVGLEESTRLDELVGPLSHAPMPDWHFVVMHVLLVTILSNIGKMFAALCYRRDAHWRERLAVSVAMWPRGEVGAGVLVVSLTYGIGGPVVTVAVLSLALNLAMTGVFILIVKRLLRKAPRMSILPA